MKNRVILLTTVAVGGMAYAMPATAQTAPGASREVSVEDIVVTARKREESIMKVPVVTNIVTGDQIERTQTTDIRRVADQIPGFLVGEPSSAAYGAQLSLRGVGTSVLNGTIDQSISLNLDNQQFTQGIAYTAAMFDLQNITVLKGPQALFYGKASPGGVIAIASNDPTGKWEAIGRMGYEFEAATKQGELILSGPLTNTLGIRLAGRYSASLGYFKNITGDVPANLGGVAAYPSRSNHTEEGIFRGTLKWEPDDKFSARLKVTYDKNTLQGRGGQFVSCPDGTAPNGGIRYISPNEDCKLDRYYTMVDMNPAAFPGAERGGAQFATTRQTFGVLELNYHFDTPITLTSVTGYYDVHTVEQFNAGQTSYAGPPYSSYTNYNRKEFTEEARVTSDFKDFPVNFTLGAFYQNVKQFKLGQARLNQTQISTLGVFLSNGTHSVPNESISFFGQLLWKITPKLELAGGARWTHEDRKHLYKNLLVSDAYVALAVPELKSNRVSPEVTLTYTPTDNLTVFAAYKKGYKSGSFNSSGSFKAGDNSSFGDEEVEGGEIGIKSRLFDHALSFNLSGYSYKYKGLQVGANGSSAEGVIITRTLNAASAKVYGLEADATYRPPSVEGLAFRLAANWNHARYESFLNAPCYGGQTIADGCNLDFNRAPATQQAAPGPLGSTLVNGFYGFYTSQNLSGGHLLRSPDFSANAGVDYEMPVAKDMRIAFGTSVRYSSSYFSDIVLREDERQNAYAKVNANITLYGPEDHWELSLIGNNLNDKVVLNKCNLSNGANGVNPFLPTPLKGGTVRNSAGVDELACTADPGREVWIRATVRF